METGQKKLLRYWKFNAFSKDAVALIRISLDNFTFGKTTQGKPRIYKGRMDGDSYYTMKT